MQLGKNIKSLVKDIYEVSSYDCWTTDDTYDYALEIVEEVIKKFFLRDSKYINADDIDFLNCLIGKINMKISHTLESCTEEWGDPYRCENAAEAKYRKSLKAKTMKSLESDVKKAFDEALKVVRNNKEEIEELVKKAKQEEKVYKQITSPIQEAIWSANDKRRKNATVKIAVLVKALTIIRQFKGDIGNK